MKLIEILKSIVFVFSAGALFTEKRKDALTMLARTLLWIFVALSILTNIINVLHRETLINNFEDVSRLLRGGILIEREFLIVFFSLTVILFSIIVTITYNPTRMTKVAGVSIGFIISILFAETVIWFIAYVDKRVEEGAFIYTLQATGFG